jgi:hypothetical protein
VININQEEDVIFKNIISKITNGGCFKWIKNY